MSMNIELPTWLIEHWLPTLGIGWLLLSYLIIGPCFTRHEYRKSKHIDREDRNGDIIGIWVLSPIMPLIGVAYFLHKFGMWLIYGSNNRP